MSYPRGPTISQHMILLPRNLSVTVAVWRQYELKTHGPEHQTQIPMIPIRFVEESYSLEDLK